MSLASVQGAPSTGSIWISSPMGGAVRHAASSRTPSILMRASVRTAVAVLRAPA